MKSYLYLNHGKNYRNISYVTLYSNNLESVRVGSSLVFSCSTVRQLLTNENIVISKRDTEICISLEARLRFLTISASKIGKSRFLIILISSVPQDTNLGHLNVCHCRYFSTNSLILLWSNFAHFLFWNVVSNYEDCNQVQNEFNWVAILLN